MSILNQLSSRTGDRTEGFNLKVVAQCLRDSNVLTEIATGLHQNDAALMGDCAEVLTKVAEVHPDWIAPFTDQISPLLIHNNTRVRWEAAHALALVAALIPASISPLLPLLMDRLRSDKSVIVRDYAADTIAAYASTGAAAAECTYPLLKEVLTLWDGKQAGHALQGLTHVARLLPNTHAELRSIAGEYLHSSRGVVAKTARELLKVLKSQGN